MIRIAAFRSADDGSFRLAGGEAHAMTQPALVRDGLSTCHASTDAIGTRTTRLDPAALFGDCFFVCAAALPGRFLPVPERLAAALA
jgi:hypothetical protein